MVRCLRWHCPPDVGFEIRALAVWGRARYLSVTEAPHNTSFHTWMGKKQFRFFQTAETGNRTPDSGVKGSGVSNLCNPNWDTHGTNIKPNRVVRGEGGSAKFSSMLENFLTHSLYPCLTGTEFLRIAFRIDSGKFVEIDSYHAYGVWQLGTDMGRYERFRDIF